MNNRKQQSGPPQNSKPPKKKFENLPRTGIEYPFLKERREFLSSHKEFELLSEYNTPSYLVDEYIRNDAERAICAFGQFPVVYDCIEPSPYYDSDPEPYIDEMDAIEIAPLSEQQEGIINEPYQKKYLFNPSNLPYTLERSNGGYQGIGSESLGKSMIEKKTPKINRYFEKLKPFYKIQDSVSDKTLVFESRFESGNLKRAVKVGDFEYDLYLKNDYGTSGFTQWFYFRVQNTRKDQVYRFNIVNMMKPDSTYSMGMKPLFYSVKDADKNGMGWFRDGTNIAYYQNARKQQAPSSTSGASTSSSLGKANMSQGYYGSYYSLSFEIKFKYDLDTVYIAHCYPYTYSDQCEFIKKVCTYANKDKIRRTVLCKSLAGNDVEMLIVTNFNSSPESISMRKAVVLACRVHPGETNSSFIMNGVVQFLVGEDEKANFLRETFVFKIIPMLNPDGVIVGNYRCSLIGQDLNRQWIIPSSRQHPVNYHTKLMMKKTLESRDIYFFADFHGHSTKRNVFMFGNAQTKPSDKLKERVFPTIFSELNENFSLEDCCFDVQKSRESTARIVMWREFNLINSFTLESSFCGPSSGKNSGCHFNTTVLEQMGEAFCRTLAEYATRDANGTL